MIEWYVVCWERIHDSNKKITRGFIRRKDAALKDAEEYNEKYKGAIHHWVEPATPEEIKRYTKDEV